jgi:hypothetical protein
MAALTAVVVIVTLTASAGPVVQPALANTNHLYEQTPQVTPTETPRPPTATPLPPTVIVVHIVVTATPQPTSVPTATPQPTPMPTATSSIDPPLLQVVPLSWSVTCPRTSVILTLSNIGSGVVSWSASVNGNYYYVNGGKTTNGTIADTDPPYPLTITNISGSGSVTIKTTGQTITVPITCQ